MGRWNAVANEIFLQALDHQRPDQRRAYLAEACGPSAELRAEVASLLEAREKLGSFLELPATGVVVPGGEILVAERPGTPIGRYQLLEEIGEGGMGVVYLAEQIEPVRRQVALKIIKPGMDTREVIARFEAERQALALMDHPNVAHVLDAGATDSGRPYFVMELVHGITITAYCDQNSLSVRQRLQLFVLVCQAVQHAHQKGIIHRDLKPSNVLVTLQDGVPVPKVIDFGIAKATHQRLTETPCFTDHSRMVGTPMCMSPEQAATGGLDVDTRSDIYSLGVLLYELLTGSTPFAGERLREVGIDELRRVIREEEPLPPSARISTLGEAATKAARQRKTDATRLGRLLRGELDWIVMKAMEKDRIRRYPTAVALGKDIERYLQGDPVDACPPSTAYRLRKFVRRNVGKLVVVALVGGILLVATVVSTCLAVWALRAEGTARVRLADANRSAAEALDARALAMRQEQLAKQQRDAAEYDFYVAGVRLAKHDLAIGGTSRVFEMLRELTPKPGRPDWRGWEWYYLFSQCHGEQFSFPLQRGDVVAWAPDGTRLATVDAIGLVNIWDISDGSLASSLKNGPGWIRSLTWRPDGKQLAAGGDRRTVVIWDVNSGRIVQTLRGPMAAITCVRWNPTDGRLASGATDGTIVIWDPQTAKRLSSITVPRPFHGLDWCADGQQIRAIFGIVGAGVSACRVGTWDTKSDELGTSLLGGLGNVAFDPASDRVAIGVSRQGLVTSRLERLESVDYPGRYAGFAGPAAFNPSGERLAAARGGGAVTVFDSRSGTGLFSIPGQDTVASVAWHRAGSLLAVGYQDNTVKVWNTAATKVAITVPTGLYWNDPTLEQQALDLAFSPDDRRLLVGGRFGLLKIWDLELGKDSIVFETATTGFVRSAVWSPSGRQVASVEGVVRVRSSETGQLMYPKFSQDAPPFDVAWSPNDDVLAVSYKRSHLGEIESRVRLWDAHTGKEVAANAYFAQSRGKLSWRPDGGSIAVAGEPIRVWDSQLRNQTVVANSRASLVDWSPDGRFLAANGPRDDNITIYDARTWQPVHVLVVHNTPTCLKWHPHMPRLAYGSSSMSVRILDATTGFEVWSLEGSDAGFVNALAWSHDGLRLATGGRECTVRIWDATAADQYLRRHDDLCDQAGNLLREQKHREAIDILTRMDEVHPGEERHAWQVRRIRWLQADQLARRGQLDKALPIYETLIAHDPALPDFRLQLPAILFASDQHDAAFKMLEEVVARRRATPEYRDELAILYESKAMQLCAAGRFDEASVWLGKLAKDFPDRPDFRAEIAFQMAKMRRLEQALAVFEKLGDACERRKDYRPELARLLILHEEHAVASEIFKQLAAAYPDRADYAAMHKEELVRNLIARWKFDEANAVFRELVRQYGDRPQCRKDLAEAFYRQGLSAYRRKAYDQALPYLDEAIRLDPAHVGAYYRRGLVYDETGEWDKAVASYREAIRLKPDNAQPHFFLGGCLNRQGKMREAIAEHREAIRCNPEDAAVHNSLAWLLATTADAASRQPADALKLALEAVERSPERATYWNTLGVAYYRNGEWKEAITALEKSETLNKGGTAHDFLFRAMAHWQLGEKDKAREWYEKAAAWLKDNKPDEELTRFRAEANELMGTTAETSEAREPKPPSAKKGGEAKNE